MRHQDLVLAKRRIQRVQGRRFERQAEEAATGKTGGEVERKTGGKIGHFQAR
jgi:hypothetical protein